MPSSSIPPHQVTELLVSWSNGDQAALEQLTSLVYAELRRLARHYMSGERSGHTLQTTALVNEAYLRLIDWKDVRWQNRAHFFAVSAQMMRHILVDFARNKNNVKHGAGVHQISLEEMGNIPLERSADLVALDEALGALASFDLRKSQIVEMRFFGGLSVEETAEVLKINPATVTRDWNIAKAWLYRELSRADGDEG